jgi:hypothetical protein
MLGNIFASWALWRRTGDVDLGIAAFSSIDLDFNRLLDRARKPLDG